MQTNLMNWTLNALSPQADNPFTPPLDMRESIATIKALPPLPGTALRILDLSKDPNSNAAKLAEIIELDPLLTAQIIRWASSPLYGYKGKISTVRDAISRVLGFDFVFDVALGLLVLTPLKAPLDGALGMRSFWTHALASTRLMEQLVRYLPAAERPEPQVLFLAGLLHNIGHPLMAHQFPEEFHHLSQLVEANPGLPVFNLESFAFGVNHTEIGTWLMNSWSMPRAIVDVVYHHHNPYYRGDHYRLSLLVHLSDCLLGQIGLGDAVQQRFPEELWPLLNLTPDMCQPALERIEQDIVRFSDMAERLIN